MHDLPGLDTKASQGAQGPSAKDSLSPLASHSKLRAQNAPYDSTMKPLQNLAARLDELHMDSGNFQNYSPHTTDSVAFSPHATTDESQTSNSPSLKVPASAQSHVASRAIPPGNCQPSVIPIHGIDVGLSTTPDSAYTITRSYNDADNEHDKQSPDKPFSDSSIQRVDVSTTWIGMSPSEARELLRIDRAFQLHLEKMLTKQLWMILCELQDRFILDSPTKSEATFTTTTDRNISFCQGQLTDAMVQTIHGYLADEDVGRFPTGLMGLYLAAIDCLADHQKEDDPRDTTCELRVHFSRYPTMYNTRVQISWIPDEVLFNGLNERPREGEQFLIVPRYQRNSVFKRTLHPSNVAYTIEEPCSWLSWDDHVKGFKGTVPFYSHDREGKSPVRGHRYGPDAVVHVLDLVVKAVFTEGLREPLGSPVRFERTVRTRLTIKILPWYTRDCQDKDPVSRQAKRLEDLDVVRLAQNHAILAKKFSQLALRHADAVKNLLQHGSLKDFGAEDEYSQFLSTSEKLFGLHDDHANPGPSTITAKEYKRTCSSSNAAPSGWDENTTDLNESSQQEHHRMKPGFSSRQLPLPVGWDLSFPPMSSGMSSKTLFEPFSKSTGYQALQATSSQPNFAAHGLKRRARSDLLNDSPTKRSKEIDIVDASTINSNRDAASMPTPLEKRFDTPSLSVTSPQTPSALLKPKAKSKENPLDDPLSTRGGNDTAPELGNDFQEALRLLRWTQEDKAMMIDAFHGLDPFGVGKGKGKEYCQRHYEFGSMEGDLIQPGADKKTTHEILAYIAIAPAAARKMPEVCVEPKLDIHEQLAIEEATRRSLEEQTAKNMANCGLPETLDDIFDESGSTNYDDTSTTTGGDHDVSIEDGSKASGYESSDLYEERDNSADLAHW